MQEFSPLALSPDSDQGCTATNSNGVSDNILNKAEIAAQMAALQARYPYINNYVAAAGNLDLHNDVGNVDPQSESEDSSLLFNSVG